MVRGVKMSNNSFTNKEWGGYARCHASVLSSFQLELYKETARHLKGDIVDCGCGTARLAPFLADQARVSSYTGVDAADVMVSVARNLISTLANDKLRIVLCKIEDMHGQFTSGASIHSYYAWNPEPERVLRHIYQLLLPGALFVLATPNDKLDMPKILRETDKELMLHPDYVIFKKFNLQFASNQSARFVPLNVLIKQVQDVGFEVQERHQKHYLGGVNYLLLKKS
jgi:SAM-dependent methyltransferase